MIIFGIKKWNDKLNGIRTENIFGIAFHSFTKDYDLE